VALTTNQYVRLDLCSTLNLAPRCKKKSAFDGLTKGKLMISTLDRWGPFASDLNPCERRARLRSLRAIVRMIAGPRGERLPHALDQAETDSGLLARAAETLNSLAALHRRRIWAAYAGLIQPMGAAHV
jgi:hypothetical protein